MGMILQPANREELSAALAAAHHAGHRVERADLRAFRRILAHVPEDMTVTAEAGLTLAALQEALRAQGQWLPIDPPHPERLTLGALLASNASGPRRFGHGTIRDHLIGLQVALADGRLIRSGGKVVKNVAGYDLLKLFVGSRGTLGLMVEATFKLLPLPEAEYSVQARCDSLSAAGKLIEAILDSELTPTVLDLHRVSTDLALCVTVTFAGTHEDVDWQLARAANLGLGESAVLDYEARFHALDAPAPHCLSVLPSRLIETLEALAPETYIARAGNGVIACRGKRPAPRITGPEALLRRIKDTFDPKHILPELPL